MSIVTKSDFTGEYLIAQDQYSNIDSYIATYEKKYLTMLLGADLYALFIADLTPTSPQVPQTQRFLDVFNPFDKDECNSLIVSQGMKQMLIQFIYFHVLRDNLNFKSTTGTVRMKNENSSESMYNGYNLVESYNQGVCNAWSIQWFVNDNSADYSEENMQHFELMSGI